MPLALEFLPELQGYANRMWVAPEEEMFRGRNLVYFQSTEERKMQIL